MVGLWGVRKSTYKVKPLYIIKNEKLLGEKIISSGNLKIIHNRKPVKNLSVTKILIWNHGNKTLLKNDMSSLGLRVKLKKGLDLFQTGLISQTKPDNKCKLTVVGKQIHLKFDYFDKNEGVLIRLFHSGKTKDDVSVEGTVKQFGKFRDWGGLFRKMGARTILFSSSAIFLSIFLKFFESKTNGISEFFNVDNETIEGLIINVPIIFAYFLMFMYLLYPRFQIPKNFRDEFFVIRFSESLKDIFRAAAPNFFKKKPKPPSPPK